MFLRLLLTSVLLQLVARAAAVTNSSKGQTADALTLPKQASVYDDYDLNDQKLVGAHVEGSGGAASLDEYADDEEEEQLSKITATTVNSSMSTGKTSTPTTTTTTMKTSSTTTMMMRRTSTTTITTTMMTTTTTTTTIPSSKWMKSTSTYDQPRRKNENSTISSTFNDLDVNEFKDDHEEYADDLEDDAYYNEPTISNRVPMGSPPPTRYPSPSTRAPISMNHTAPIWILFSFLTRPPIAAGILAGKSPSHALSLSQQPVLSPHRSGHWYFHLSYSSHLYYSTLSQT